MQVSRRSALALLTASALAGSSATAVTALGDGGGRAEHPGSEADATVLKSAMAPSVPADPAIHGVAAGGAPWVLRSGQARLRRDGRMSVRLRGLVIPVSPANGTPGPVMTVTASLYCGADSTPAGTIGPAPISRAGDARIVGRFAAPAKCLGATILVHPNGIATLYIAASGFGG
jgi:hypothetical protein